MIIRHLLAALVAGLFVGVVMTPVQYAGVVPLILHAEQYEAAGGRAGPGDEAGRHDHSAAAHGIGLVGRAEAHSGHAEAGASGEGAGGNASLFESRMMGTLFANLVAGGGFALMLAGVALLTGRAVTRSNGISWGMAGFATVALAPALGLPPELPAMPVADLLDRQIWWTLTVLLTAGALWLLVFRREVWARLLAIVLMVLPHVLGAPHPADLASVVPPTLAAEFAVASLVTGAVFWALLGLGVGSAMDRLVSARPATKTT